MKCGSLVGILCEFVYVAAEKMIQSTTDALRLNGLTRFQTRHNGVNIDRVQVLGTLYGIQIRRRSHHSLLCPLRTKVETLALRADMLLTKRLEIQRLANARFGGSGFVAKATMGIAWICAQHKVWAQV